MPDRSVRVVLTAQTSQYQAAMAKARATAADFGATASKAGSAMSQAGSKVQSAGRSISQAGSTMTRRVTFPLAALGAASVKTAIDFETAFTGVRKTIDATEKQYRQLERGIQKMAEHLPASVEEISAVAEAAGQLGIKRQAILGFTKTMIDLGESTNLSADQAATSLARFANITKMPQDEFDKLGATIVDLGNKGASTEAEIVEMALRIAGAGSQVGMTEAQILGFAESLSSVGIRAEAGGSSISKVFIEMANAAATGGKDLKNFAAVADMTTGEFKQAFEEDAAGAAITFIEGLGKIKEEGGNVFAVLEKLGLSEIRVRDALLRASGAGDLFRKSQETANQAAKEGTALSKEAAKRYDTEAAKLEMMKNKWRNIMATFGNDLMPVLRDVMREVSKLAKWFKDLDPEMRQNIIKWGAIAIAAGPLVRIFGGIATALGKIMQVGGGAVRLLGKGVLAAGGAGAGTGGVGTGAAAAGGMSAGAVGASIFASAGLGLAVDHGLDKLEDRVKPKGSSVGASIGRVVIQGVRNSLTSLPTVGVFFHDFFSGLEEDAAEVGENVGELTGLINNFPSTVKTVFMLHGLPEAFGGLNAYEAKLAGIPRNVTTTISTVGSARPAGAPTGPQRAMGGDVYAGHSYEVGERGVEIFTPARNGYITPNHRIGGDGAQAIEGTLIIPGIGEAILEGATIQAKRSTHRAVRADRAKAGF